MHPLDGSRVEIEVPRFFAVGLVREPLAHGANIESKDNDGATCLLLASKNGNIDVVRELLAQGAHVEAKD